MTFRQIPILTIGLLTALISLHGLVADKSQLYFSAADIFQGEVWRLVSGHFIHADLQHLLWNCLGLGVLGTLLETRSRGTLMASLGVGVIFVSALLLMPFSHLDYYCGLSGVLNTLLLVALWFEWRLTRSWLIVLITFGCIAKVVIEVSQGTSILTNMSWPPYAWSHLAGLLGGLFVICMLRLRDGRRGRKVPLLQTLYKTDTGRSSATAPASPQAPTLGALPPASLQSCASMRPRHTIHPEHNIHVACMVKPVFFRDD